MMIASYRHNIGFDILSDDAWDNNDDLAWYVHHRIWYPLCRLLCRCMWFLYALHMMRWVWSNVLNGELLSN